MQLKDSNESDQDVQNKEEEKFDDMMKEIAAVKEEVDVSNKKITVVEQEIAKEQEIAAVSIKYEEIVINIEKKRVDIKRESNDQIKQSHIEDLDWLTKREARLGENEKLLRNEQE